MSMNRRQMLRSLAAGAAAAPARSLLAQAGTPPQDGARALPLRSADGRVDWSAVRALFPLSPEWTHLSAFLFVSHPRPVAQAIDRFRRKLDSDTGWIELAAFADSEGRPFKAVKRALAEYTGGAPDELCLTSNTTSGLAMIYHGLRIRPDQEILTTDHDHYVHHESIRYSAARSGAAVRYATLYDEPRAADAGQMVDRLAKAISAKTRAVGITWVHSSTGVKIPVADIAAAVARANRGRASDDRCLLIVDGVHGFANQDVEVARMGADFFAASNHKWLLGPRGTGFVWGRGDAWPELRPTIPSFDPEEDDTWKAWMDRSALPPTRASFVSPGGFVAYEHLFAVPAAIELHHAIGRDRIAARIAELNGAFRDGAARLPRVTLHTPRDPGLSGGLSCFEVAGMSAEQVTQRLAAQRIRTNSSPYKISYPRVSAGVMNSTADVDRVLRALRAL